MIHILTGDGAGKTTSSIGHLIRVIGQEGKGLIVQFYKNDRNAGDYKFFFDKHPSANVDIIQYGVRCLNQETREAQKCSLCGRCMEDKTLLRRRVLSAIQKVKENAKHYDSIVLDEILVAYSFGHISKEEIKDIVASNPDIEWYLTGRLWNSDAIKEDLPKNDPFYTTWCDFPPWINIWANYITEMKELKHPFHKGVEARVGVEY